MDKIEKVEGEVTLEDIDETTITEENETPEDEGTEEVDDKTSEVEEEESVIEKPEGENSYNTEQVTSIVKTRVANLNKKIEKYKKAQETVDKLCETTGLTQDQLVQRLGTLTDAQQAKILNLTPEQFAATKVTRDLVNSQTKKSIELQRDIDERSLKLNPRYKDFDLYKEDIYDLLDENPKLSMSQAYLLIKGETAITSASRDSEQRTKAKLAEAGNKKVVKASGAKTDTGPKLSPNIINAAKIVGMDPKEYALYQGIVSLDDYNKIKKG